MKNKAIQIKAADGANKRGFSCVLSSEIADREGEVVLIDGLNIENYKNNPVVMFAHGKDPNAGKVPVGKMVSLAKVDGKLIGDAVLAERPEAHPKDAEWLPDTLLSLIQQGCLNTVSIGFMPIEGRKPTSEDFKAYGEDCQMVTTKADLFELSLEPTQCNQDALITAVSKGLLPKKSKAYEGEVKETPAPEPQKIVAEVAIAKPRKNKHAVRVRVTDQERMKNIVMVRVKGGLYA